MAKREDVKMRSDYLNFLRFTVTESAAGTFTQTELDTNLSAERGVMMEIHSLEIESSTNQFTLLKEVAAGSNEDIRLQLTRDSKAAIIGLNDADCVALLKKEVTRSAAIGTDAGPLWIYDSLIWKIDFALPIPYVKPSIFVGIQSSLASAGTMVGRIGYTLRDIDRETFLELLVALQ